MRKLYYLTDTHERIEKNQADKIFLAIHVLELESIISKEMAHKLTCRVTIEEWTNETK